MVLGILTVVASYTTGTQTRDVAVIEGIVTRAGTREPIGGVTVELSAVSPGSASREVRLTATTLAGEFRFVDVRAGDYRLVATDPEGKYAPAEYLQRNPRGRGLVLPVGQGENIAGLRLEMTSTSSISGRILDDSGFPVGYARVFALETVFEQGRRILNVVQSVQTNDLGEFRLFWLLPGEYYLAAKPESAQRRNVYLTIYPPGYGGTTFEAVSPAILRRQLGNGDIVEEVDPFTYYGGTIDFQRARKVMLPAGASLTADIALANRVVTYRVRGRVTVASTGQAQQGATVRAIPLENSPQVVIPYATTNAQGVFEIAGVLPGRYVVFAVGNSAFTPLAREATVGWTPIEAGARNIENVTVALRSGFRVTGRIQIEGSPLNQRDLGLTGIRLELRRFPDIFGMPSALAPPAQAGPASGIPLADGSFLFDGVFGGDYQLMVSSLPPNSYVKSIRLGERDIAGTPFHMDEAPDRPVELTIGQDGASVDGLVVNKTQVPASNATVLLVPDPPLQDRTDLYRTATSDSQGRFNIRAVPPGTYTVMAWESVWQSRWLDPEFMRDQNGLGTSVRLDANGQAKITIQAGAELR